MWRTRSIVVLGVLAGVLIFGAVAAYAGWQWNAALDVNGSELRTVWEITDSNESLYSYSADFRVLVPKKADATIIEQATNETVTIKKTKKMKCLSNGTEVEVKATIDAGPGATGTQAKVTLYEDGVAISQKSGAVGQTITQKVVLSSNC